MKKSFRFLFAAVGLLGLVACADVPEIPYPLPDPNGGGDKPAGGLPFTSASLNDFTVQTIEGLDWSLGSSYAKATGYVNPNTTATKTWLVSPAINTTVTGDEGVSISFENVLRYVKSSTDLKGWHKVLASKDYTDDVSTATWTDLNFQPVESSTQTWDFYDATPISLPAEFINVEKVYIAFYFQCDATNSTTWELKNFSIQEGSVTPTPPTPTDAKAVTIAEFNAAAVSTTDWYELTGVASGIKSTDPYGNFDLEDATGKVYVYGLLAEKGGAGKAFQDLVAKTGLANGDKIKIHGQRGDYQGKIEVVNAYFVEIVEKGDNPGPGPGGEGNGSKESPYNVAYVLSANNPGTEAWVKGYIVGTIPGKSSSDAVFGTENASNTNIIIADAANCTDVSLCVPVQLPQGAVRDDLNLQQHPENLGKTVFLKGSLEKYFGLPGLKSVSEYSFEGGSGGGGGDDTGDAIFSADFTQGEKGFTIKDVKKEELDYIWAIDTRFGWKASAHKGTSNYPSDSWIVSPAINLANASTATLAFSQAVNYMDGNTITDFLSVCVSTDYSGDVSGATWTKLSVDKWPEGSNWTFVDSQASLDSFCGKTVYVAFRYTSTAEVAPTWEIKTMTVK
ncbi:MAG: choice-of-anchor J domain-containing protein [Bacteroidaceae bacterium]|nr:choice-of-anchor J domain-containing protein [Bacteroidaceae bacterium]